MTRVQSALLLCASALLVVLFSAHRGCLTPKASWQEPSRSASPSSPLGASFDYAVGSHLLTVRGERALHEASLLLWVDGVPRALPVYELRAEPTEGAGVILHVPLRLGLETAEVRLAIAPAADPTQLRVALEVAQPSQVAHAVRIRLEMEAPPSVFASGAGELLDLGRSEAPFVTLQADAATAMLGVGGTRAALTLERFLYPAQLGREALGLAIESPSAALETRGAETALQLAVGTGASVLAALYAARGEQALNVHGTVRGASVDAAVYATGETGAPEVRALVDAKGDFALAVPKRVGHFVAENRRPRTAADNLAAATSSVATFEPGVPWPLLLDLSPSGTCKVHVFDGDSQRPLTARLIVRGVDGARDPWFGPDYRASGAGPVADLRDGVAEFELPAGTYKVQATHGPMYSIDEAVLQVRATMPSEVVLRPRRVIPALGRISADLHVHARPSYDSPVQTEDRVLSLVAAGVDFAVPTEHNVVGDYEGALRYTGQHEQLRFVPGVEVTTFAPKLGHFGVFPYPLDAKVPRYRATSLPALFAFVRRDPERVLVVHHPFLGSGMGYFDRDPRFDPQKGYFGHVPLGFDAIELLNGYETLDAKRTEQTLSAWLGLLTAGHHAVGVGSSDAHRILYGWAGYPRTVIRVQDAGSVDLATLDTKATLRALKAGRAQATTGPILELTVQGASPGDTVRASPAKLVVHVTVRAAPWVDVRHVDLYVGSQVATRIDVDAVPLRVGPEHGTDDEVFARSVRLSRDLELDAPRTPSFVVAVAHGETKLEWVLPATALPPLSVSNPIWIQ